MGFDDIKNCIYQLVGADDNENYAHHTRKKTNDIVSVCRIKKLADAQVLGELICEGRPIIVNFEDADKQDAQRIVDFLSGVVFGTGGSIEMVSPCVLAATPHSIEVSGAKPKGKDVPMLLTEL